MSLLLETSVAATRGWCSLYTKGLPPDERVGRRAEIESDLWEHKSDGRAHGKAVADIGYDILVRFVLGIPSDLLWRRGIRRSQLAARKASGLILRRRGKKMATKLFVTFSAALAIVLGAFLLYSSLEIFSFGIFRESDYLLFGISQALTGVALIASVPVGPKSPRKSAALVVVAGAVFAGVHFRMAVIVLPFALILGLGAWLRVRATPPPAPQA